MNRNITLRSQAIIRLLLVTFTVPFALSISSVRSELLFSDSFEYSAGPLAGQGPPAGAPPEQTGWSLLVGNPQVGTTGLRYPKDFSTGGAAYLSGAAGDRVFASFKPVTSGVVWLGFLINVAGGGDEGFAVVNLGSEGSSIAPGYGLLFESGVFGIDNDTGERGSQAFTNAAPGSSPSWLVVKLDFDAGTESLFVNPSHGSDEPATAFATARLRMTVSFQTTGIDQIFLNTGFNKGLWGFDEVRIATTFAEVRTGP